MNTEPLLLPFSFTARCLVQKRVTIQIGTSNGINDVEIRFDELICSYEHYSTMLSEAPLFDYHYAVYVKNDPAREPVAVGRSIPGTIASAGEKTGRDRKDFEVEQITAEQYRVLKQFLDS
jgi:hypothetical protein